MDKVEIIDRDGIKDFHLMYWGGADWIITQEQLSEFLQGKVIALTDGEYSHTIQLKG